MESNHRINAYQTFALTTWLHVQKTCSSIIINGMSPIRTPTNNQIHSSLVIILFFSFLEESKGLEPLSHEDSLVFKTNCRPFRATLLTGKRTLVLPTISSSTFSGLPSVNVIGLEPTTPNLKDWNSAN